MAWNDCGPLGLQIAPSPFVSWRFNPPQTLGEGCGCCHPCSRMPVTTGGGDGVKLRLSQAVEMEVRLLTGWCSLFNRLTKQHKITAMSGPLTAMMKNWVRPLWLVCSNIKGYQIAFCLLVDWLWLAEVLFSRRSTVCSSANYHIPINPAM